MSHDLLQVRSLYPLSRWALRRHRGRSGLHPAGDGHDAVVYIQAPPTDRLVVEDVRAGHAVMARCAPAFAARLAFVPGSNEQRATITAARALLATEGIAVFLP